VQLHLHSSNTPSWRGAQLKEAQGQLYLLQDVSRVSHRGRMRDMKEDRKAANKSERESKGK
jgi:hypothetical protein